MLAVLSLAACQKTDFGPSISPENGILNMGFVGQTANSTVITLVPALEKDQRNTIEISLIPGTDYKNVMLDKLVLSSGAVADIKEGDVFDLTKEQTFSVTAPNGVVRQFVILPPEKFNHKQGDLITARLHDGTEATLTLGEWLCLGQNKKADINERGDTLGFFRNVTGSPYVSDRYATTHYLRPAEYDKDDYFIISSDGTYQFSYGKNGRSSSTEVENPAYEPFKKYLLTESRGFWRIIYAANYVEGKWFTRGLELTDGVTGNVFLFNYIDVAKRDDPAQDLITFNAWYNTDNYRRPRYIFKISEADTDWEQYLVE